MTTPLSDTRLRTDGGSGEPAEVSLMIKPVGALCNLRCAYCYYLPTLARFGGRTRRMSEATLKRTFADTLPRFANQVTIAWQGGEPTLAGIRFFEKALELQRRYARPGQQVNNALQTNGTRLTPEWCRFLRREKFLVGLSLDGPDRFHDHYRVDARGEGSSGTVHHGLELLSRHAVEFNVLCVLNDRNVEHPDELLGYFLNRGVRWLQFIPAIEWGAGPETGEPRPAPYSPSGGAYGRFLCRLFDLWFERHRTNVSVRLFDAVLQKIVMGAMPFCILAGSCHSQMTVEHDGSVFGCDHFVEPRWKLGHVDGPGWFERLDRTRLRAFAARKQRLPEQCRACRWRELCYGGCPKHRPHRGEAPEPSRLCAGYRMYYAHAIERLEWLAGYLRRGEQPPPPAPVSDKTGRGGRRQMPQRTVQARGRVPRNVPCPCGSGLKFKRCHGKHMR